MFSLGKLTITDQQKANTKNHSSTTVTHRVNHFLRPHPSRYHQQASVAYLGWVFASRAILYYFHFTHTMYCSPLLICFNSYFCLICAMCTEGEWEARTYARKVKTTMRQHFALPKTAIIKKSKGLERMQRNGILGHCWWECKFLQSSQKTMWRFLKKWNTHMIQLSYVWVYIQKKWKHYLKGISVLPCSLQHHSQ